MKKPKNIYLVMQQGGSSREWYAHGHNTLLDARKDVKGCAKAAYNTVAPIRIPAALTKALCKGSDAETQFYTLLEDVARGVAGIC